MLAIIDYGMGNRRSVEKAFEHITSHATLTDDPEKIQAASGLVLPGVGAFPEAVLQLKRRSFFDLIRARVSEGVPILGICLGMQLLFTSSTEHGATDGLDLLAGDVSELAGKNVKLPHIGWNEVRVEGECPLFKGLPDHFALYHVHSFAAHPLDSSVTVAEGFYGVGFPAIVHKENIFGVQGHPEKSSQVGLKLLKNFVRYCTVS